MMWLQLPCFYTLWIFKAEALEFQITFVIKNCLKNMENNLKFRIFHGFSLQSNCHSCTSMIQVKATPKRRYNIVPRILCIDLFPCHKYMKSLCEMMCTTISVGLTSIATSLLHHCKIQS